jgi:hypothetical protein
MSRVSSVVCVGAIWASLFASAPVAESQILQIGELKRLGHVAVRERRQIRAVFFEDSARNKHHCPLLVEGLDLPRVA